MSAKNHIVEFNEHGHRTYSSSSAGEFRNEYDYVNKTVIFQSSAGHREIHHNFPTMRQDGYLRDAK